MLRNKLLIVTSVVLGLALIGMVTSTFMGRGGGEVAQSFPTPAAYPATWTPSANFYARVIQEETGISDDQVVVALEFIPRGSKIGVGSIGRRVLPAESVPPDTITDETEAINNIAKADIVPGQIIARGMLVEAEEPSTNGSSVKYSAQTQDERIIIYTGQIWLVIRDTQEAIANITKLVEELGGYVSEINVYQTSNNVQQGSLTIRVPSEHYEQTMTELRALAVQVQGEELRTEDVTEEFVDQEARLTNLKAGEQAIQNLLEEQQQGNNIADIAAVQQKLAEVRSQIEQTEGRIRYLSDQAFFSTITVQLIPETLPPTPTPTPTPLPGWSPQSVAKEASQSLVLASQRTADSIIWGVIFLPLVLVYLIPIIIIVLLVRWGWRKYKARKEVSAPTPETE